MNGPFASGLTTFVKGKRNHISWLSFAADIDHELGSNGGAGDVDIGHRDRSFERGRKTAARHTANRAAFAVQHGTTLPGGAPTFQNQTNALAARLSRHFL